VCDTDNTSSAADDANLDDALDFLVVQLDDEICGDSSFEF
jgi:hypothetical protein